MQEFFSTYYLVILVIAVIIVILVLNFIHTKQKKKWEEENSNDEESYLRINNYSQLTDEQYKKLSIGAIYSEQQSAFINSLETGLEKEKIMNIVQNWWGLNNAEEAIAKLEYLDRKGFAFYFPMVYNAFLTDNEERKEEIIIKGIAYREPRSEEESETMKEDIGKAYSQTNNLTETFEELLSDEIIQNKEDIKQLGVVGWDCGRLNFLARICYDAGYISEQQAWDYTDRAYILAKRTFSNWEDFAKSYIIGRAMWGGADSDNSGIADIAKFLLNDENSPWTKMPL